jgi:hypothetical protein
MKTAKIIRDNRGRMDEKSTGLGEISKSQIKARAAELAIIDGRRPGEFTEVDYLQARDELAGVDHQDPETLNGVRLPEEAAATQGHRTPKGDFEDEETIGSLLVEEGSNEALHNEMLEAAKEARREE